jgi:hypothetical protein
VWPREAADLDENNSLTNQKHRMPAKGLVVRTNVRTDKSDFIVLMNSCQTKTRANGHSPASLLSPRISGPRELCDARTE